MQVTRDTICVPILMAIPITQFSYVFTSIYFNTIQLNEINFLYNQDNPKINWNSVHNESGEKD